MADTVKRYEVVGHMQMVILIAYWRLGRIVIQSHDTLFQPHAWFNSYTLCKSLNDCGMLQHQ